jgi:uncharacterized RDD family membrane protein YckC
MENIEIQTAQNVDIQYKIASIGDRILAQIIDFLILIGYAFGSFFVISLINQAFYGRNYNYSIAISILVFLPLFFYDFICEAFLNGQSFGKKMLKIKVVKLDGSQPSIGSYFLRWLLKPIDVFISQGSIAILTMLINGKGQRLGDLAANTTVIKFRREVKLDEILIQQTNENYQVKFPQVSLLSDKDIEVIKELINIRTKTDAISYQNIIEKAKKRLLEKMEIESDYHPLIFLDTILKDYNHLNSN